MTEVYVKKIRAGRIELEIKVNLEYFRYVPKKHKIFIKPNIAGFYNSGSPCIVNPRVIGGIIEYLKDRGYREILIGELPIPKDANGVFIVSGYRALSRKYNVQLDNLNSVKRVELKSGNLRINLPEFLFNNEYEYVNVAKMKTHIQTGVSLCTKNQKGLLDFSSRKIMHIGGDLHDNIKSLGKLIKPDLCIIDGTNALEGDGPGIDGKEVKNFNVVIFGKSMEAVDWVGAQLMGLDPNNIKHLSAPIEKIKFMGDNIRRLKKYFILPGNHFRKFNIHMWITDRTCSGCSGLMGEVKYCLIRSPLRLFKLLCQAFLGRVDILTGGVAVPNKHGKIICVGDCMQKIAKQHNLTIAKGCPPEVSDFILKL